MLKKRNEIKGRRALVVEDYEPNAIVAVTYMQELGYTSDLALTGEEALSKFKENIYVIALMDVQLPDIDGMEVTRRIRAMEAEAGRPPMPVLALTARATEDDKILCMRAGMNDCLSKPFLLADLERKLSSLVNF